METPPIFGRSSTFFFHIHITCEVFAEPVPFVGGGGTLGQVVVSEMISLRSSHPVRWHAMTLHFLLLIQHHDVVSLCRSFVTTEVVCL